MADYEGNGLAAFNDARFRGWSGSVTLADLERLSAGNPIAHGIAAVWPDAPPSRMDQAYQTSIDRWKQLGKDAFFAPANSLKAFNEQPTFNNALGIMPMGTFGGQFAKTADRVALANAQRMSAVGTSREDIWTKTGWFQGPDQKWRFEIPDNGAKFSPAQTREGQHGFMAENVGEGLKHPGLQEAYPDLSHIRLGYDLPPRSGYYAADENKIGLGLSVRPQQDKSTLLHELQHAIQQREGFARGSSIDQTLQELPNPRMFDTGDPAIESFRKTLIRGDHGRVGDPRYTAAQKQLYELETQWKMDQANDRYRRSAGEVEARAVQNRMDLTPQQSKARYPWLDWDVPADQQIVK